MMHGLDDADEGYERDEGNELVRPQEPELGLAQVFEIIIICTSYLL